MRIYLRPYTKRDGSVMFYINNERGVSLGISNERGYQSSKATKGEQKLWSAFCDAVFEQATMRDKPADPAAHDGAKVGPMFNGIVLCLTDVAQVGGVDVGEDGGYAIRRDGAILKFPVTVEGA